MTEKELKNEDWKTQLARGYGNIPEGEEVEVIATNFTNFYGTWSIVEYKR